MILLGNRELLDDVSVMIAVNKEKESNFPLRDMSMWTNHNMLKILGKFPKELLAFDTLDTRMVINAFKKAFKVAKP